MEPGSPVARASWIALVAFRWPKKISLGECHGAARAVACKRDLLVSFCVVDVRPMEMRAMLMGYGVKKDL